jgi:hypothetical protein
LINGLLRKPHYRWVILVKAMSKKGWIAPSGSIYTMSRKQLVGGPSKQERLGIIGRWSRLINGLKHKYRKGTKHASLLNYGRWARLARKIIIKDNKLRSLNVNGRWRLLASKLLNKAKPPNTLQNRWIRLVRAAHQHGYIKLPFNLKMLI